MTADLDLARLADAHGVATSYDDQRGRPVEIGRDAVVGVLAALGVDASSPAAVGVALRDLDRRPVTPPVVTTRVSRPRDVPVPEGAPAELRLEDGGVRRLERAAGVVRLPAGLPTGWHTLSAGSRSLPVVVAPDRVPPRARRGWGWMVQLYATRSQESWGVGDLADLRSLVDWTARRGGDLVLVNPLHAAAPTAPMQPSPYFPASRRWTNPLYLRVEQTEAYAAADPQLRSAVDALRPQDADPDRIDRDRTWAAKLDAFALLWAGPAASRHDPPDDDVWTFATWCALCEVHGSDWRRWPAALRRPGSPAVARARADLDDRVRFFAWLQALCDEALAGVQRRAADAGMDVGVVHDLAVGVDPGGADAWMLQDALALDARVGAPPDLFNQQGQDWGLPPWHPARLEAAAYAPIRDMTRALLRHAGGVRIDHILGMFRLWWIPAGAGARDGTYVRYDADAILDVVALEAERAGAVVVGEDLGVVPDRVAETLADRDVLGTSVLWFERDHGAPAPAARWREPAMASVTTHDLPTALGWLRGEHVRVRAELGLLDDPEAEEADWRRQRDALLGLLVATGVLTGADAPEDEQVLALHRHVGTTPSRYVLAAPADAVGDLRQPNLPGTVDEYPNWRLPVADSSGRPMTLEELLADPRVERLAAELREQVR